jgi:hypothetical protein
MLDELASDLRRAGHVLAVAHDVGQVGDILDSESTTDLGVYPAIDEAVEALHPRGSGSSEAVPTD